MYTRPLSSCVAAYWLLSGQGSSAGVARYENVPGGEENLLKTVGCYDLTVSGLVLCSSCEQQQQQLQHAMQLNKKRTRTSRYCGLGQDAGGEGGSVRGGGSAFPRLPRRGRRCSGPLPSCVRRCSETIRFIRLSETIRFIFIPRGCHGRGRGHRSCCRT